MSDPGLSFPDQPRVELDQRLTDLVRSANEVLETQGRLRALLRANQAITAHLDLDGVLRRIVDSVQEVTGAQYVALGVLGERGGLEQFIHAGMDEADVARIGHLPHGEGLLGALVRDPEPIRIDDIAADPRGAGFPEGHPPMRDFLGVPIRVREVVFGNLYLTNHPKGHFSEEDEQLVRSLASTAGFAVENARLFRETRRRQEWAAASTELTARMLSSDQGDALSFAAERMRSLAEASSAFVVLLGDASERVDVLEVRSGDSKEVRTTDVIVKGTIVEHLLEGGRPLRLDENEVRDLKFSDADPFGPILAVPLTGSGGNIGLLLAARSCGSPAFTESDLEVAVDFSGRVSVALALQATRSDAERVMLFEERGRIARDLHDRVIQQLFATGMQLQGVLSTLPEGRNAERVDAAISSLDSSITQIRRVIFTLESTGRGDERATGRQRLFNLIERVSSALSVDPSIHVTGPVDAVLIGDLAEDVLAVVSEGVTNAVKHGGANTVAVDVSVDTPGVTVAVSNDGLPLAVSARRSGLANLEERATRRSGSMTLGIEAGLTVLRWAVPLPNETRASV
ncbi:GAF domain-containing protein [Amnibacterium sp.]|uniref:sensor histidine kinase n=1 Tax=Amnibacterium sp. TaxID=1872496 RepID=UPI002A20EB23|nr:Two-component system histidine kinase [Amnibacterium sp.]